MPRRGWPRSWRPHGARHSSQDGPVRPLTEHWNGSRWTILTTPAPAGAVQTFLGGTSCTSPTACTAVGEHHAATGVVRTIAERWDGSSWTIEPTPNPAGAQFASLAGVDCTGPSACLAVGSSDQGTLAERWNGTTWSIVSTPNPPGGGGLNGVACRTASACTAIGFTITSAGGTLLAERWNGTTWTIQPTPLIPAAHDMGLPVIACPSTSRCIAAGGYENDGPGSVTLAERWRASAASTATSSATVSAGAGRACGLPLLVAASNATGTLRTPRWPGLRAGDFAESALPLLTWCRAN